MYEFINVNKVKGIATVTVSNPPLNIINKQAISELHQAFLDLNNDPETVIVLLTGGGSKYFSAGADIKEFPSMIQNPELEEITLERHHVLNTIDNFPKPVIAVLNGITLGGGCEVMLACDMVLAEEHVKIGLPEVKLGIFPGWGGTQRLPRLIGERKAKEIMFTGEPISAKKAEDIGLVNKIVPSGTGLEEGVELAIKIAENSLQSLNRIKYLVDYSMNHTKEKGIEKEAQLFSDIFHTDDVEEGIQAFHAKRKPNFSHQ